MAIKNTTLGGTDWVDASSTLNGAINDTDTTITLTDASLFSSSGFIVIEDELISYTGKSTNDLTGCTRGVGTTTAASHADTTTVTETEKLTNEDLNDTFDAAFEKIQQLSAFWLNTELYDVYDDFDSYSVGSFTTNTEWTITLDSIGTYPGAGSSDIVASTNAGGTSQELRLGARGNATGTSAGMGSATAEAINLDANKHTWFRYKPNFQGYGRTYSAYFRVKVGNSTDGFTTITTRDANENSDEVTTKLNFINDFLVVAKGNDQYDVYSTGELVEENLSLPNGLNIQLIQYVNADDSNWHYVYIDDVRQSKSTVS